MKNITLLTVAWIAVILMQLASCSDTTAPSNNQSTFAVDNYSKPMKQVFRDLRYGLFIHWGPGSLTEGELSWIRRNAYKQQGLPDTGGTIPPQIYDSLYLHFNPTKFNAEEWVKIAKDNGLQYIVFVTKHCDGFCNWDTKVSKLKITSPNSPFRRDIVRELADACHRHKLRFGLYYALADWHNPDYRTVTHKKYIEFYQAQVRELLSKYGQVDVMWYDDLGGTVEDWDSPTLRRIMTELQPNMIVNDRWGWGPGDLGGDFRTCEEELCSMDTSRTWEFCQRMGTVWSWHSDDALKSPEECVRLLSKVAGRNANLLLDVGPMPDGRIESRQIDRLKSVGNWLRQNGNSIFKTRGGPWLPNDNSVSTRKGNYVYLHILNFNGREGYARWDIPATIRNATLADGTPVRYERKDGFIIFYVPEEQQEKSVTVITLELDKSAMDVPLIE